MFALLRYVHDKWLFIFLTVLTRVTLDGAASVFSTTSYSFVVILYKENVQMGIGRIQSSIGIGPII